MKNRKISYINIIVEVNDDGFLAKCPALQGAFAEGDTIDEAIFNCVDVIKMIVDYKTERMENIGMHQIDITPNMQYSLTLPLTMTRA